MVCAHKRSNYTAIALRRCGANISTTFCRKSPQLYCSSSSNEFNFHATPQCSNIAIVATATVAIVHEVVAAYTLKGTATFKQQESGYVVLCNLRSHNWVFFAHRSYCIATLNSNFAILKTLNCFLFESKNYLSL